MDSEVRILPSAFCVRSSVWIEQWGPNPKVEGSNPSGRIKTIMKEIAIVYLAAGMSSRFGGRIKQFAEVGPNGEKLIEYSLKQAIPVGFSKIIFIVGDKTGEPMRDFFGDNYLGIPIFYAKQNYNVKEKDRLWGTVDALCSAKNLINCPIVVRNGDDIYGKNSFKLLIKHLQDTNEEATIGYKLIDVLPNNGNTNRGIFKISEWKFLFSVFS